MELRVVFPPPGYFVNDPRLVVTLGDNRLYDGSFRDGFDVSVEVPPGQHVLETAVYLGGSLARKQRIELPLDAEGGYRDVARVEAKLAYSRLWGNFKKRASVSVRR